MLRGLLLFVSSMYALGTASSLTVGDKESDQAHPKPGWKPSTALQLKPEYFDYPGLKELLEAVSGSGRLSGVPAADFFQPVLQKKRQIGRDSQAAFVLRVNPIVPRHPPSLKNFAKQCVEKKSWCVELPTSTDRLCQIPDIVPDPGSTCGPTKPKEPDESKAHLYCNFNRAGTPIIHDPCDECVTTRKQITQYEPCGSIAIPTKVARIKFCHPTKIPCHNIPCTYKVWERLSTPPPAPPPRCDLGITQAVLKGADLRPTDSKFYVLVKRSLGSWKPWKRSRTSKVWRYGMVHDGR